MPYGTEKITPRKSETIGALAIKGGHILCSLTTIYKSGGWETLLQFHFWPNISNEICETFCIIDILGCKN